MRKRVTAPTLILISEPTHQWVRTSPPEPVTFVNDQGDCITFTYEFSFHMNPTCLRLQSARWNGLTNFHKFLETEEHMWFASDEYPDVQFQIKVK